jgi:hypothetical protein
MALPSLRSHEISNGGTLAFSGGNSILSPTNPFDLSQNYGNSHYDSRHNITGSYVYDLPYFRGPCAVTDGRQLSGTVFHHTGFPFTLADGAISQYPNQHPRHGSWR